MQCSVYLDTENFDDLFILFFVIVFKEKKIENDYHVSISTKAIV